MSEKTYKSIRNAAVSNLVMGILALLSGIVMGVLLIISGAKLLRNKSSLMI